MSVSLSAIVCYLKYSNDVWYQFNYYSTSSVAQSTLSSSSTSSVPQSTAEGSVMDSTAVSTLQFSVSHMEVIHYRLSVKAALSSGFILEHKPQADSS